MLRPEALIFLVCAVLALVIAGFVFLHFSNDYNVYVVKTDSMASAIKTGTMVFTGPVNGPLGDGVKPGTIVAYEREGELITHRVLSVDGDTVVTKGDAVEDPDPWPVFLSDVRGVYLFKIPYAGYVHDFLRTKPGWLVLIIIPAALLVALIVKDIIEESRRTTKVKANV